MRGFMSSFYVCARTANFETAQAPHPLCWDPSGGSSGEHSSATLTGVASASRSSSALLVPLGSVAPELRPAGSRNPSAGSGGTEGAGCGAAVSSKSSKHTCAGAASLCTYSTPLQLHSCVNATATTQLCVWQMHDHLNGVLASLSPIY